MKINKCIISLIICMGLFLPHIIMGMKNDFFIKNNSLIPSARIDTIGRPIVVIKDNMCALMEQDCARVWDLRRLSADNLLPLRQYDLLATKDGTYSFMDLNHNGSQLLLHVQHPLIMGNTVRIYNLLTDSCSSMIEADYTGKARLQKNSIMSSGIKGVRFFDTNSVITDSYKSIHIWQPEQKKSTCVSMPVVPTDEFQAFYGESKVAVHQTEKKIAYFIKAFDAVLADSVMHTHLFTNSRNNHFYFIFFVLEQMLQLKELVHAVVSKLQLVTMQYIGKDVIYDTIYCMEYSADGNFLAVAGMNHSFLCTLSDADTKNKNCITSLPIVGFSAFYPNNKTLFIMTPWGGTLLGLDIKTKKIIYKYMFQDKEVDSLDSEGQNQWLAFNKRGDKFAAAFSNHCQIYDVSPKMQKFLNTYDPETVPEIRIKSKKKITILSSLENNRKKGEHCIVQ